ncbi:hypothetical protein L1987_44050 [Smallanthus sonchifolius]|uniref:Uncharacterized protein n=1 Tax=Smallanthus sonchifolius TaxID=185202 RepID=A0ACB9GNE4_9ASTR|nr:hypothetical protein L1987_44050 [Smallanthus sonchifolius]
MLDIRPGVALAFVSILNLHLLLAEDEQVDTRFKVNENKDPVKENKNISEFLRMLRAMSPKLVLLVEQESDHNLTDLVDRVVEGLHYCSAVFDSIDTTFTVGKISSEDRIRLEDMVGKEILNVVACEGLERVERHERISRWAVRFSRARFKPVNMWLEAMEEARQVIEGFGASTCAATPPVGASTCARLTSSCYQSEPLPNTAATGSSSPLLPPLVFSTDYQDVILDSTSFCCKYCLVDKDERFGILYHMHRVL